MSQEFRHTFILGKTRSFTYQFPFSFSADGDGVGIKATHQGALSFTRMLFTKFGLYVDPLSMWEYVKNGVKLIIRELSTYIGVTLPKEPKKEFAYFLSVKLGMVSNYIKSLSFNRNFSNTFGLSTSKGPLRMAKTLITKIGTHTEGLFAYYNYSKTVIINPSIDGALSSYPIKLTIHRTVGVDTTSDVYVGTDCSFDYADIYFQDESCNSLYYWIESYTDSAAIVWVTLINIPASPTTTFVQFYYGSSIVSGRSSGTNTFTFFDDFSGDLSKWTTDSGCSIVGEELVVQSTSTATKTAYSNTSFGTNYAMRARLKSAHDTGNYIEDASISDPINGDGVGVSYCSYYSAYNNNYYNLNSDGRSYLPVSGWGADVYHTQDMIRNSTTNNKFYVDNINLVTLTDNLDTDSHPIRFFTVNNTAKLTIDWVVIRPYTANEPTFGTWGSKVTYAASPFRAYLLTLYRKFNTSVGLVPTRLAKIAKEFTVVTLGLSSSISNAVIFVRSLSSKIGAKSSFIYSLSFNRFLNSSIGFTLQHSAGLFQTLNTSIGLVTDFNQSAARYLSTTLGLVSDYIITKSTHIYLNTTIGIMGFSFRNTSEYIRYLTTALGLVATQGIKEFTTSLISKVGLVSTVKRNIESYFNFVANIGLVTEFIKYIVSIQKLSTSLGLMAVEGYRNIGVSINTYVGLTSNYIIGLTYNLFTSVGLKSSFNRLIEIYQILQKAIGVSLTGDKRVLFEEVLSATIGLVSDVWYKSGGRVREMITSFGLTATLSETTGYYRDLISSIGVVANKISNIFIIKELLTSIGTSVSIFRNITTNIALTTVVGLQSVIFRNIISFVIFTASAGLVGIQYFKLGAFLVTKIGLIATRGAIKLSSALVTKLGLVSLVDRHRHDYETLTASIGLVATKASRWFGLKRFKTLKFLNPSTKDNKKLWIGK